MNGKSTADEKPKTGRASDAYRAGMLTALRSNFHQVSDVLREGVDADGGYLVPEEYDSRLIRRISEENTCRKLGHTITTSGEHKINIAATAPAAAWIEEGGALSFGDATFAQILLDAHQAPCRYQGDRGTALRQCVQAGGLHSHRVWQGTRQCRGGRIPQRHPVSVSRLACLRKPAVVMWQKR